MISESTSPEPSVQATPVTPTLRRVMTDVPAVKLDPAIEAYRSQRAETAKKFGGLIPLAQGNIASVDITKKGDDPAYVVVVFRTAFFDEVALRAAPGHNMGFVLFEDQRDLTKPV